MIAMQRHVCAGAGVTASVGRAISDLSATGRRLAERDGA
eukprot:SAG11_NODE_17367_length_520_cov_2.073634_2_plen_38_part_01